MNAPPRILVVDDDERLLRAAVKVLAAEGHRTRGAADATGALAALGRESADVILADLRLPDLDGLALLKRMKEICPAAEVIMISGHGSIEQAVEAMRLGAYDFIEKPVDSAVLLRTVAKALEKQRLAAENASLRFQLRRQRGAEALLGDNPAMQHVKQLIRRIASTDVAVLIQGESGTGKELVADSIHGLSARHDKPFIKLSCAAIPENLLESELFGHERGAFTGASATKPGKFELADGGTLLLDEIAEMSPSLQAKLLRVLQDGRFQRLGGTRELRADVRLLSATHADIPHAVAEGEFRQDLYYRINTLTLVLPPLRDRRDDIPLLATHFLRRFSAELHKDVRTIAPAAWAQFAAHAWPGNVRELEHVIQRAVALADTDTIDNVQLGPATAAATAPGAAAITIPIGATAAAATRQLVAATIRHCGGNKLQAARVLGISPRTMYRQYPASRE